jgi:hypothetical protein
MPQMFIDLAKPRGCKPSGLRYTTPSQRVQQPFREGSNNPQRQRDRIIHTMSITVTCNRAFTPLPSHPKWRAALELMSPDLRARTLHASRLGPSTPATKDFHT